ncbi:RidA family protein [Streptococcus chenjunshii]|uniref:RidA family protein n=1 Tax=Streptococcus chenjunshii TaxID=2173853 RepID=A0A372KMY7_9STRE|nr:RidA family protein [Streptococcus chenjunshii]AXQ79018.1 RidA family protein [Streptococcus chenjunshii]RFU51445.1 RidA family protein [Streptococcus chenjunshii]RFU53645.1 RidA family protein [Streptococcus chenjunshii]
MGKIIHTDKAPKAIGPYVQGKIAGNFLFASGQVPLSPETGEIIGSSIEEQTQQVLKNIAAILKEAGTDFEHVVKTTCFLSDMNDFNAFNQVYAEAFKADFPSRSAVEVARLPKDVKIEIEVIAYVGEF